jgi:hypothetical protein
MPRTTSTAVARSTATPSGAAGRIAIAPSFDGIHEGCVDPEASVLPAWATATASAPSAIAIGTVRTRR